MKMDCTSNAPVETQTRQVIIVTGLSGAGKSGVLRGLEDLGFYCVDNLPVPMLSVFLNLATQTQTFKVALGIDARGEHFFTDFILEIQKLKKQLGDNLKIIFLTASSETLIKRFQETRRTHPLAKDIDLIHAIKKETKLLVPIMDMADIKLDTNALNTHDLRKWVNNAFANDQTKKLIVNLTSFGFKYGIPLESNMIHDLRSLPNPYFIPSLKELDGRTYEIQNYLFSQPDVVDYWKKLTEYTKFAIDKFCKEGRFFVNISIGCTGGKHRSVTFVEKLGKQNWENVKFLINHRDVEKG
jgi:RNase adapter protein RapZ